MSKYDKYLNTLFDGNYQINKIIGVGGMAVVFEAFDIKNDRVVAIKMLREEYNENKQYVRRFVNEAKTLSMLEHPNIVKIYKVNTKKKPRYMVQQRIQGVTLMKYMEKRGKSSFGFTLSVTKQILDALIHAAEKGIIHRDIKPHNIMLLNDGSVVLTDFGIASRSGIEDIDGNNAIGTAGYVSPEQALGEKVDGRSDLYSLGIVMYQMLTGRLPFDGDNADEVANKQIYEKPLPPHNYVATIPTGLEQIILKSMEKDRNDRFSSALMMKNYLEVLEKDAFAEFTFQEDELDTAGDSGDRKKETRKGKKEKGNRSCKNDSKEDNGNVVIIKAKEDNYSITPSVIAVFCAFTCVAIISAIYILITIFPHSILNVFNTEKVADVEIKNYLNTIYNDQFYYDLIEEGYKVDVEFEVSNIYPENMIIAQSPSAGRILKQSGLKISLTVAVPSPKIRLPDHTMSDYRMAVKKLKELGFEPDVQFVTSRVVDNGSVISCYPAVGSMLEYGTKVTLYVSKGCEYQIITVGDYRGYNSELLTGVCSLLYRIDNISYEYSDTVPEGCVISQSLQKGLYVPKGSFISFVISLGRDPDKYVTPTPEITEDPTIEPQETQSGQTAELTGLPEIN